MAGALKTCLPGKIYTIKNKTFCYGGLIFFAQATF